MINTNQNIRKVYEEDNKQIHGTLAKIFIVFAILCLFTSLFFNFGSRVTRESITTPAIIGPIKASGKNTVYEIEVEASVAMNSWLFVSGQVLNSQQDYLFAFGKELWQESGRDLDGAWSESDVDYDMKVTLQKPGEYYFKFVSENGNSGFGSAVSGSESRANIIITRKQGSSLPHMWAGIFALILAIVFNEIRSKTIGSIINSIGDS